MSLVFMVSVGFSLSSVCLMVIQPLSLGFMLMMLTFCVSALVSMVTFSWYGYLLFLVYIGGLLVMFMYVISLIPNLIFLSSKVSMYFFVIFISFVFMNFFVFKDFISSEMKSFYLFEYSNMSMGGSSMIMMYDNFMCYLLLAIVLLFVLISVVKICYYCEGPLRVFKFKYYAKFIT
uniref:NADH dehydrogenase subunit 6 n=1 Tax=Watasenia scintillans TaxID=6625 RepID=Q60I42_WATSC|nr:NADH dehydrogenase subunit 6 [Watasenia scintillans]AIL50384.1 NADH dehydrogenase subunit 6 [Watasenia scintillans]BAD52103.1 NADH dehydrogenase subunit 6 [Watasenia scintillans]BAE80020.1 NADH dehydrogenase subunit 6 [Watasenia scintillans]